MLSDYLSQNLGLSQTPRLSWPAGPLPEDTSPALELCLPPPLVKATEEIGDLPQPS